MVILAFGLVYVFWGSTYLGIAIAVEHIPPALMCATRFLIAGTLMLAYCALRGRRIAYSPRELWHMAAVGILLLMGGNLTLSYAEQVVPSGLSALLIAVTPLWFLVLDAWLLGDHHISRRGLAGLALGIVGMDDAEGLPLIERLAAHFYRPEYQMRWSWEKGAIAIWDNRLVQHYGVPDQTTDRSLERITVHGGAVLSIADWEAQEAAAA